MMQNSFHNLFLLIATAVFAEASIISVRSEKFGSSNLLVALHNTKFAQVTFDSGVQISSADTRWGGLYSLIATSDARRWIGITSAGQIMTGQFTYEGAKLSGMNSDVQVIPLSNPNSAEPVRAESMSTISAAQLYDTDKGGFYVRVDESQMPIYYYPQVNPDEYSGSALSQQPTDPLSFCPGPIREELANCPRGYQSIESLPSDAGESVGSLIFVCEVPFESDGLLHGWVCNPSTGDSSSFRLGTIPGWTLADLATCPTCDPGQVFLLSRNETGGFSVDSVLIESLLEESRVIEQADDSVHGRMRLLDATSEVHMQSLALVPDATTPPKLRMFVASGDINKTVIVSFNLTMLPAGSIFMKNAAGDDAWVSIFVIVALLLIGVAIPIAVYKNPKLRTMIDDWKRQKESALLGLNEDDDTIRLRKPVRPIDETTTVKGKVRLEILIE